jgi:hypothetical protein
MLTVKEHLKTPPYQSNGSLSLLHAYPVGLGVKVSIQNSKEHCCGEGQVEIYTGDHPFLEGFLLGYCDGHGIAACVPIEVAEEAMRDYAKFLARKLVE